MCLRNCDSCIKKWLYVSQLLIWINASFNWIFFVCFLSRTRTPRITTYINKHSLHVPAFLLLLGTHPSRTRLHIGAAAATKVQPYINRTSSSQLFAHTSLLRSTGFLLHEAASSDNNGMRRGSSTSTSYTNLDVCSPSPHFTYRYMRYHDTSMLRSVA